MQRPRITRITAESVEHYPPGRAALAPGAGDFIVIHGSDFFSRLIRFGETLRVSAANRRYAYWNHAALVTGPSGTLVEATAKGVRHSDLVSYTGSDYYLVRITASDEDRSEVVGFGEWAAEVHASYGWLTIASIVLTILTGCKLTFFIDGEFICSGLVARAQERTRALFSSDPVHITPAQLAQYYGVPSPAASAGNAS
jgi:hypothetical protein